LKYVVYSTKDCPKCEQLKLTLGAWGVDFQVADMASAKALTELRVNGIFTLSAPVLQIENEFYTVEDLFDGDTIKDLDEMGLHR